MLTPPEVCGVRLLPLSLMHSMTLDAMESPYSYMIQVDSARIEDLKTAVWICSRQWSELKHDMFECPDVASMLKSFSQFKPKDFQTEKAVFDEYISDYMLTPAHGEAEKDHQFAISAPWQFHHVRILCSEYNFSESQAWNMAINLAHCYVDCYAESQGDKTLMTGLDEAKAEAAKDEADGVATGDTAKVESARERMNQLWRIT
jgi:hypothetical protein